MASDGGPAFPLDIRNTYGEHRGMSLLDWFAGQALCGLLTAASFKGGADVKETAIDAYKSAQAMLNERPNWPGPKEVQDGN